MKYYCYEDGVEGMVRAFERATGSRLSVTLGLLLRPRNSLAKRGADTGDRVVVFGAGDRVASGKMVAVSIVRHRRIVSSASRCKKARRSRTSTVEVLKRAMLAAK